MSAECERCGGRLLPTPDPSVVRCDNGHEEIVWTRPTPRDPDHTIADQPEALIDVRALLNGWENRGASA